MAILGDYGFLRLRREAPPAVVITTSSININSDTFTVNGQEYWPGDEIYIYGENGIPISPNAVPNGTAMYVGGRWDIGANRIHIADDNDKFWLQSNESAPGPPDGDEEDGDAAWFYSRGETINSGRFYVYIDQLQRIALYPDRRSALSGERSNRQPLYLLDFGMAVIAPTGTQDYDNAVAECISLLSRNPPDVVDSTTLETICDYAPTYDQPLAGLEDYNNADIQPRSRIDTQFPWEFICQMKSWQLETSGDAVDTTILGTKWGENVKSLITGGGTVDFFVDSIYGEESRDSTAFMRLLLMTERGSIADAQFFFIINRETKPCGNLLPGDLYYECKLLLTNIAINVRPDDLVLGTATFVSTGPITLKSGPN